jgi:hypothetical protein
MLWNVRSVTREWNLRMCLVSPNTDALTPLRSHATPDPAPAHVADGTAAALRDDLIALLGHTAVKSPVTDLVKYATDACTLRQRNAPFHGVHR